MARDVKYACEVDGREDATITLADFIAAVPAATVATTDAKKWIENELFVISKLRSLGLYALTKGQRLR